MIKAVGKFIDTLPVAHLFSQEEARADEICIEVDRYHGGQDLSECTFMMRGITESGGETESVLEQETLDRVIRLRWRVEAPFTAEAGTLALDLFAVRYVGDPEAPPQFLLRYQLPPVQVRSLPDGEHVLDSRSYTDFLLKVRETAENAVETIGEIIASFRESPAPEYEERLAALETEVSRLRTVANTLDTAVNMIVLQVTEDETLLHALEERMEALTPIVILTESQYNALPEPDEGTLYVVKEEAATA